MIDYIDTIPYLLLLLLLIINISINSKASNCFCFLTLFIFSAIRFDVGYDYMSYYNILKYYPDYDRFELFERILQQLSAQYYLPLFYIINSFITVYFVKRGIEKLSPNISLSAFAFLCIPLLYTHSFSIIRFWSGTAILFYASTFLYNKKWKPFILLWLLSLGFHNSMIIGILFIPLYIFRFSRTLNITFLIISFLGGKFILTYVLGGLLPENIYTDSLVNYANKANTGSGLTKLPYVFLFFDIIALLFMSRKTYDTNLSKNRIITIYNIGVCILFLFSFDATLSSRLCRPFLTYLIILIPTILKELHGQTKHLATLSFILITGALYFYAITIYNASLCKSEYLPYRIIFFENY